MAAAGFLSDLKRRFDQGDMTLKFIYFNVGVLVLTSFLGILLTLFKISTDSWGESVGLTCRFDKITVSALGHSDLYVYACRIASFAV